MSFYTNFTQEALADLLTAYESYIDAAFGAGLPVAGWKPLCVEDFYEADYQKWDPERGNESFAYLFENAGASSRPEPVPGGFTDANGTRIYREGTLLMCQFDDEENPRYLRSRIQDIKKGDAFIVDEGILVAEEDAHQNLDEPDSPWIVEDEFGDAWFEEDIEDAEKFVRDMSHDKQDPALLPVVRVDIIRQRSWENAAWTDSFWVDAKKAPSIDLFRTAIQDYLNTGDGHVAIKRSSGDFNWGDAMTEIPGYQWEQYGIYPADPGQAPNELGLIPADNMSSLTFVVNQDEVLIPESYFKEKSETARPLADMLSSASNRAKTSAQLPEQRDKGLEH